MAFQAPDLGAFDVAEAGLRELPPPPVEEGRAIPSPEDTAEFRSVPSTRRQVGDRLRSSVTGCFAEAMAAASECTHANMFLRYCEKKCLTASGA